MMKKSHFVCFKQEKQSPLLSLLMLWSFLQKANFLKSQFV